MLPIEITPGPGGAAALALSRHIDAVGSVTFGGHPGDSAAGWQVGFLQAEWVETNWASYRGARSTEGSSFVQRGRFPARTQRACLDNAVASNPFHDSPTDPSHAPSGEPSPLTNVLALPANPALPLTVKVYHYDKPADSFDLQRTNSRTAK